MANNVTVITRPGNALGLDQTSTLDLKTTRSRLPGKTQLVLHILLFVDLRVFNEIILNPLNNPYYEYRFARSHHQIPIKKHPSIPFSHRTLGPHLKKHHGDVTHPPGISHHFSVIKSPWKHRALRALGILGEVASLYLYLRKKSSSAWHMAVISVIGSIGWTNPKRRTGWVAHQSIFFMVIWTQFFPWF